MQLNTNSTFNLNPTLTIRLSERPCRETVDHLEAAGERFGCTLEWNDGELWVWSEGKDLLFDCFLIAVAEALPLIRPRWDLSIESISSAA